MNCNEVRQHWHLFYDSEGDAEQHLRTNAHLEMCDECSRWFREQSRLEDRIARELKDDAKPTPTLWSSIESRLTRAEPVKSRRQFAAVAAIVTLAASLLLAISLGLQPPIADAPNLAELSVALHDKLVSGRQEVAFASGSPLEVENYLRTQVSFPVRCPPREDAGFEVRGGGTGRLADDPVAYVVGQVDGKEVSLFILSRDSLPNFPGEHRLLRTREMHRFRRGNTDIVMKKIDRNLVLIVGQADADRLERVLEAYGTYGHGDPEHGQATSVHDPRS